jgi:hypothetical protein
MAKTQIDYSPIESAYYQGVPLSELAKTHCIKIASLRAYAMRHGWAENKRKSALQALDSRSDRKALSLAEKAENWKERIGNLVQRKLKRLEGSPIETARLPDLERIARITKLVDDMARRTYGLDSDGERSAPVSVNISLASVDTKQADVVDVE